MTLPIVKVKSGNVQLHESVKAVLCDDERACGFLQGDDENLIFCCVDEFSGQAWNLKDTLMTLRDRQEHDSQLVLRKKENGEICGYLEARTLFLVADDLELCYNLDEGEEIDIDPEAVFITLNELVNLDAVR